MQTIKCNSTIPTQRTCRVIELPFTVAYLTLRITHNFTLISSGYGGLHPAAVRNDFRQLAVNNIAESVGAGIGNAKEDGVPGSAIHNYDNVPYPAYPAAAYPAYAPYGFPYAGAGFYGAGGYGFPYHFPAGYYNGAATVVNTKPVHYEAPAPVEPVKSVDPQH